MFGLKIVYLISCCKEKLQSAAPAKDFYQSRGFKERLSMAKSHNPDSILILSAKHHIVEPDQVLEPYDVCLSNKSIGEQKKWAEICIAYLSRRFDLKNDKFVILATEDYYKYLIGQKRIENYILPSDEPDILPSRTGTNLSIITDFLKNTNNAYCDDCLSKLTGIYPRQQINQICNKNSRKIKRNDSGKCQNCRKTKIVRSL